MALWGVCHKEGHMAPPWRLRACQVYNENMCSNVFDPVQIFVCALPVDPNACADLADHGLAVLTV